MPDKLKNRAVFPCSKKPEQKRATQMRNPMRLREAIARMSNSAFFCFMVLPCPQNVEKVSSCPSINGQFSRFLRPTQILILEILSIAIGLKFSPSLNSTKFSHLWTDTISASMMSRSVDAWSKCQRVFWGSSFVMIISTLLFWDLPFGVLFPATGRLEACPVT